MLGVAAGLCLISSSGNYAAFYSNKQNLLTSSLLQKLPRKLQSCVIANFLADNNLFQTKKILLNFVTFPHLKYCAAARSLINSSNILKHFEVFF